MKNINDHKLNIELEDIPTNRVRAILMRFKKFIGIPYPYALSLDGWDDWKTATQLKMPIRWWLFETVPDFINKSFMYKVKFTLTDLKWGFIHRYIRKHQYNIIRPSTLPPAYYDARDLILHANMHVLANFLEHEKESGIVDWGATEETQHVWSEANAIYEWWINKYPNRDEELDKKYPLPKEDNDEKPMLWMFYSKYENTPEAVEYKALLTKRSEEELVWEQEEEEMLIRLMKIRLSLWN